MKVAFDVKGTLDGGGNRVMRLLEILKQRGHEITIWSSVYSYAAKWSEILELPATEKYSLFQAKRDEKPVFDVAVEDDYTTDYLATRSYAWVDQIPDPGPELWSFVEKLEEMNRALK